MAAPSGRGGRGRSRRRPVRRRDRRSRGPGSRRAVLLAERLPMAGIGDITIGGFLPGRPSVWGMRKGAGGGPTLMTSSMPGAGANAGRDRTRGPVRRGAGRWRDLAARRRRSQGRHRDGHRGRGRPVGDGLAASPGLCKGSAACCELGRSSGEQRRGFSLSSSPPFCGGRPIRFEVLRGLASRTAMEVRPAPLKNNGATEQVWVCRPLPYQRTPAARTPGFPRRTGLNIALVSARTVHGPRFPDSVRTRPRTRNGVAGPARSASPVGRTVQQ